MTTTNDRLTAMRDYINAERAKVETVFERLERGAPRLAADEGISGPAEVEAYVAEIRKWLSTSRAEMSEAEDRVLAAERQRSAQ